MSIVLRQQEAARSELLSVLASGPRSARDALERMDAAARAETAALRADVTRAADLYAQAVRACHGEAEAREKLERLINACMVRASVR